jgi:hypothetical protein
MAIDVTKVKRTRGGHEVRIYATDGKGLYPIHGAYCNGDWWVMQTWTSDGKVQCGPEGPYDLVEEPQTVELDLWVNVYRDGTTTTWHSADDAEAAALRNRFACFHIKRTVTEGEGL